MQNNTQIIEFFTSENRSHWFSELEKCRWDAGKYLCQFIREKKVQSTLGETAAIFMLVSKDKLLAFCTFAPLDNIQPTELSPWIGFVYTFPEYRGNHYAGLLLNHAEQTAKKNGCAYTYISTDHVGLYEKYGYELFRIEKDVDGEDARVYRKQL